MKELHYFGYHKILKIVSELTFSMQININVIKIIIETPKFTWLMQQDPMMMGRLS